MNLSRKHILFIFGLLLNFSLLAQVREFDKLEMLYDQGHYKAVYRKSGRLLDNPEYDYSRIPTFYRCLSLFQLAQNEYWLKRNPEALREARKLFLGIKSASDGLFVFEAHIYEVSALRRDLISWSEDLRRSERKEQLSELNEVMLGLFDGVPDIENEGEVVPEKIDPELPDVSVERGGTKTRKQVIKLAKKQVGVPYVWAGNDPNGFDCSGFTSYIMAETVGTKIPRRAQDQFESSVKLKQKEVQKGDLIFFHNGSRISHVGIVVSDPGEELTMIHASSTKGIVITNVEQSSYWKKRIHGFGTFVNKEK
ncbi:MAG: NlpC/P60 family protein [Bacteroidetes bacterium]|nr:MAG: NlpC/P60 family protein [Bacteroidota bacterium]